MGTAALAVVFGALAHRNVLPAVTSVLSMVIFWVSMAAAVIVVGLAVARWVLYPRDAWADLRHPIKGAMSATLPGALLVVAVAVGRVGPDTLPVEGLVNSLAIIGGAIALLFGWVFLGSVFAGGATPPQMITGAWFIPPVVAVIVPTALAPFIGAEGTSHSHSLDVDLLGFSWVMLGVGTALFFAITAVLVYRSATAPLPAAKFAPTLSIGVGPAGLIGLDLLLMAQAAERLGVMGEDAVSLAVMVGGMFWGFGAWWAIASLFVLFMGYGKIPFALSWWGFTFPLAAWTIAGLSISAAVGSTLLLAISVVGAAVLMLLWLVTVVLTVLGIVRGTIWD